MKRHWFAAAALFPALIAPAQAVDCDSMSNVGDWATSVCTHFGRIADEGSWDLYVTGYTWHDPHTWTDEKRAELNANAWGGGIGKHLTDEHGNDEMLYGLAFADSHNHPELMVGYGKLWLWPSASELSVGAGYTVGLTTRNDILGGVPFPFILPLVALRYRRASVMGTFIPSLNSSLNSGNVGFLFGRYEFK
ncbi:lipid A palmitoyltransferase PagP [Chitiniphilus shinanonensis]|uniref:Lipid A palmitoyltransferase PagP n=1 Tax=Chitiniphilus shinanonensis TaxID=553088 RepID=A0ABQ6BNG4_9NEIS|nr:hypothetical protein [Chitiniphilus shinanonensis]GLS03550.1 lipid A palmitoyltransferase PagP [Chitiniphilus shinanonensis]